MTEGERYRLQTEFRFQYGDEYFEPLKNRLEFEIVKATEYVPKEAYTYRSEHDFATLYLDPDNHTFSLSLSVSSAFVGRPKLGGITCFSSRIPYSLETTSAVCTFKQSGEEIRNPHSIVSEGHLFLKQCLNSVPCFPVDDWLVCVVNPYPILLGTHDNFLFLYEI